MENYEGAWKALKVAVAQRANWDARSLLDLIFELELEYHVSLIFQTIGDHRTETTATINRQIEGVKD